MDADEVFKKTDGRPIFGKDNNAALTVVGPLQAKPRSY